MLKLSLNSSKISFRLVDFVTKNSIHNQLLIKQLISTSESIPGKHKCNYEHIKNFFQTIKYCSSIKFKLNLARIAPKTWFRLRVGKF